MPFFPTLMTIIDVDRIRAPAPSTAPVVMRTFNKVTTESLHLGRNIKNKSVLFVN